MSDSYTIRLQNSTTYTPEILNVTLTGCAWVTGQALNNGDAIAANNSVVGMVEPTTRDTAYSVTLTVHYGWVAPGPNGTDVGVKFGLTSIGVGLLPNIGTSQSNNALTVDYDVLDSGPDQIAMVTIS